MIDVKTTLARRFKAAGLTSERFVSVKDGAKMCVDHDTRYTDPTDVPGSNYGIYTNRNDPLVILDVDYHREGGEDIAPDALAALNDLPRTLKLQSPHVPEEERGGHRILKVAGEETPADLFDRVFGTHNPMASWGEVIAKNKYVVGAGSQLDGCDKEWCQECAKPGGGWYDIKTDRPIAEVDPDTLVDVLVADPDIERTDGPSESESDTDDHGGASGDRGKSSDRQNAEHYDDLPRATVEAMLEAIPGDQKFDDWLRTGYAVYEWDDGDTGKEVFENWSKTNEKWEPKESQRQINYIWDNDKSRKDGTKATVGTLIYIAKKHGWSPNADRADVSPYYNVDLATVSQEHAVDGNPYLDNHALLKACLYARGRHSDLEDAKPPYRALVALAESVGLGFEKPEDDILGESTYKVARRIYDDLDPEAV